MTQQKAFFNNSNLFYPLQDYTLKAIGIALYDLATLYIFRECYGIQLKLLGISNNYSYNKL